MSCTLVGAIGTLKAFSISYEMYVIVEFLETVAGASAFPAAYILSKFLIFILSVKTLDLTPQIIDKLHNPYSEIATLYVSKIFQIKKKANENIIFISAIELLGQDKRVHTTAFLGIMLVLGGLSFALLAKIFSYWRTFILVAYPPSILFLLYIYFLPESIRWLLTKGRKEEALKIITRATEINKVKLSDETMRQLTEEVKPVEQKKDVKEKEGLWIQVSFKE